MSMLKLKKNKRKVELDSIICILDVLKYHCGFQQFLFALFAGVLPVLDRET